MAVFVVVACCTQAHKHTLTSLRQVVAEGERTSLAESSRRLTYDLLCAMANPARADTRGLSHLAQVAERFAFSLVTQAECGAQGQRSVSPRKGRNAVDLIQDHIRQIGCRVSGCCSGKLLSGKT